MTFKLRLQNLKNKILLYFCRKLLDDVPRGDLPEKQYTIALSKAYQNPGIMNYLDLREAYLKIKWFEEYRNEHKREAAAINGALVEIEALRARMRTCYTQLKSQSEESVNKVSPIPRRTRRRHSL